MAARFMSARPSNRPPPGSRIHPGGDHTGIKSNHLLAAFRPHGHHAPLRGERARSRRAAEQRDELASFIKKMSSRGTIAKRGGLAKRPRSAKGLPFSSSRVGRKPVGRWR
jgi:hypothetical protein